MANFVFLTFYDKICLGPRILSATAKAAGHQSRLIIFKDEVTKYQIVEKKGPKVNYEGYLNGFTRGTHYDVDPWTATEIGLLKTLLSDLNPDVLCISTRSFWTDLGASLVEAIRDILPQVPIVAGGWGPSLEPEKYLTYCDYVCFGEGEGAVLDMGDAIAKGRDFREIQNLIFKDGNQVVRNDARKPIENLDEIPFPDFSLDDVFLVGNNAISTGHDFYNEKMYDIFLGRGCPMSCSYCMSGKWKNLYQDGYGLRYPKVRWRSPERCIEELETVKKNGALFIRFKDEVFPFSDKWLEEFLDLYKKRIHLPFFAYLAADFHRPEIIAKLHDAGLKTCGLGIQSASDTILNDIYQRPSIGENFKKLALALSEREIEVSYDVITHCPFEKISDMKKTFQFLISLPVAELLVFKLNYFPGSPIERKVAETNPVPEKETVYRWYSILFCMTGKSKCMRSLAIFIEKHGLFSGMPAFMKIFFVYYLLQEGFRKIRARRKFKGFSLTLPGMLKMQAPVRPSSQTLKPSGCNAGVEHGPEPLNPDF